jgi:leucyl-tRNA synthetase
MVCKESYRCPEHGYRFPAEVDKSGRCAACGQPVEVGRTEKMSKSKKNVVDPDELLAQFGADTIRMFSLFAAPPEKDLEWSDDGVQGAFRFLNRIWRLVEERAEWLRAARGARWSEGEAEEGVRALRRATHQTIAKVTRDLEDAFHFNTAIAGLMELTGALVRFLETMPSGGASPDGALASDEAVRALVVMLAPFAPHVAEELWELLGGGGSVFRHPWPAADPSLAAEETLEIVVQVNGKLRGRLQVPRGTAAEAVRSLALEERRVRQWIEGHPIRKVIVVPDKLVNIVLG